ITQLMNYMAKELPGRGEHRVLILLDEFQNLGKLENVMEAATILGGYGVPTWFFVQSLKSVDTIYREEGRKTLVNSARVQVFFGAQDAEDLKYISDTLGERTEVQKDVSKTHATMFDMHHARTVHVKEVRRPLMRPDEIRTMSRNKCIILPRGSHAIFGTRNFYFADAELSKRAWMPIPAFKASAAKEEEPDAGRKAAPKPNAGFGDMLVPPRFAHPNEAAPASTRRRGAVFAAKAGRRPPPPTRPVTVTTYIAANPKRSTNRPPLPRNTPDLAAITRAAERNHAVSTEAQAKIAEAISRVAKVAGKAANKSEADAGLRDLETALQGVD
ncbi:TraG/TraD/VirD4 family protein, partial [Mesorhizobium sp. M5C.F.Ca.IN.020.29.1.1]